MKIRNTVFILVIFIACLSTIAIFFENFAQAATMSIVTAFTLVTAYVLTLFSEDKLDSMSWSAATFVGFLGTCLLCFPFVTLYFSPEEIGRTHVWLGVLGISILVVTLVTLWTDKLKDEIETHTLRLDDFLKKICGKSEVRCLDLNDIRSTPADVSDEVRLSIENARELSNSDVEKFVFQFLNPDRFNICKIIELYKQYLLSEKLTANSYLSSTYTSETHGIIYVYRYIEDVADIKINAHYCLKTGIVIIVRDNNPHSGLFVKKQS